MHILLENLQLRLSYFQKLSQDIPVCTVIPHNCLFNQLNDSVLIFLPDPYNVGKFKVWL